MISLDLTKSSEVRIAGDQPNNEISMRSTKMIVFPKPTPMAIFTLTKVSFSDVRGML